jgi:2-methylfumaryl-CoA isomerase
MRIIEVSAYVATPLAGMTLAQLGADVIRVEPIGGQADRTRMPLADQGASLYWAGLNQGKRAVEVDFRSAGGRAVVRDLVARSGEHGGIVISNTTRFPDLSYDELVKVRPDVVQILLTGTRDGSTAVDYTVQAEVGLHGVTGPEGTIGPVNDVLPFWDVACGGYLSVGLLAAERHRLLTGQGQFVSVSLRDVAMATLSNLGYLSEAQLDPTPRPRAGNYVYGMFGRDFSTLDGARVMLVILTARHWGELLRVTRLDAVFAAVEASYGVDFSHENIRYEYRELLSGLLKPWFESRTATEVLGALGSTSVLCTRYRDLADLAADGGQVLADDPLFNSVDHPGIGRHFVAGSPIVMNGLQYPAHPAPAVGQHTDEVLSELLGYSSQTVRDLQERGLVGGAKTGVAR